MTLGMDVGLRPGDFVLDGDSAPSQKRGKPLSPIFGRCILRPNGCMDPDGTLYGGRPRDLRDIVLDGDRARRGELGPQFLANVRCGQTAGWTQMSLGMEIGLGPGDFVLDGNPAPLPKRGRQNFRPMFVAKRLDGSRWHLART